VAVAAWPAYALGQRSPFDRVNFDKLQIISIGASVGSVDPSQVETARVYAVGADYGEIAPDWRVVVGVSYWRSHFRPSVIQTFVDSLNKSVVDPPTAHVAPSPVSVYDVTLGVEFRWAPRYSGEIRPFVGLGLATHVINADGKLINGTFVERALDDFAVGAFATAGTQLRLVRYFGLEGAVRTDMLSGFRSIQARAGGVYYFGRLRRTPP
jgi:hypothetical protein